MTIHPWWTAFGAEVANIEDMKLALARELASLAARGALPGVMLAGMRQSTNKGYAGVHLEVEVERPQDLAHPIRATEPIGVLFSVSGLQPSVLSLRQDFPDTPHQNWSPPETPCSLCIDDRPWAEARLTATASDIVRRIQVWLAKAARGELHDAAQPPDPLFFASPLGLVLPAAALAYSAAPVELVGYFRQDNERLIISRLAQPSDKVQPAFTVLAFKAQAQCMARLRHAPVTLAALACELQKCGIQLYDELKTRLKAWTGLDRAGIRRLLTRLAIVVAFPVTEGGRDVNDFRAFLTLDTAGEIGVVLGVLFPNESKVGDARSYMPAVTAQPGDTRELHIEPMQVHFAFSRELAATISGHAKPDRRRIVLVGAGSLGSQLGVCLAREGKFAWTVVDGDHMLPHNLGRHALFSRSVGAPKAAALADELGELIGEPTSAIQADVLKPDEEVHEQLGSALAAADFILDASASVAVSRHLSDLSGVSARRVSAFFNPQGTALVVLAEKADRSIMLRDLEAQYHRIALSEPALVSHLTVSGAGVRYSGSCRALTNRIPATNAAVLSALAARGLSDALATDDATISIWTINKVGEVALVRHTGAPVDRRMIGEWSVAFDQGMFDALSAMRASKLPRETGGVLLGIADMQRKSIHVAHAMPEPEDSQGSVTGFERGVSGLLAEIGRVTAATMYQLRYVGEWHSHPDSASTSPSLVDLAQVAWLTRELEAEGLPAFMAIAGQDGQFSIVLGRSLDEEEGAPS